MNREQAIANITPDRCPNCGSHEFEVKDHPDALLSDPPQYGLYLECTNCHLRTLTEWWWEESPEPEYIRTPLSDDEYEKAVQERFPDDDDWDPSFDEDAYERGVINAFWRLGGINPDPFTEADYFRTMCAED